MKRIPYSQRVFANGSEARPVDESVLADYVVDGSLPDTADQVHLTLRDERLFRGLTTLSARERGALSLRYGLQDDRPRTFREVGIELGCSGEYIRQIEARTLAKLARCPELQGVRVLSLAQH